MKSLSKIVSLGTLALLGSALPIFAQAGDPADNVAASQGSSMLVGLILLIGGLVSLFILVSVWKVFTKAGQPGWAALIPIYNAYIVCNIVGRPGWWVILLCIPLVNFVVGIIVLLDLAKSFGKGAGFAVGLVFLPFVFWPILGFGDARYVGVPAGALAGVA